MLEDVTSRSVELRIDGKLGVITLDRPKVLNALNLEMVEAIDAVLADWAYNPAVEAILVRSGNERAFCAGGDVRAIGTLLVAAERCALARRFFSTEYRMNYRINRFPKPYIALLGGIVMGGGLGLSIHGSHRVVNETVRLSMPEAILGLFPDIGATWFLSRCPGALGRYLALVGTHLGSADALTAGLATHYVTAADFTALTAALAAAPRLDHAAVDAILAGFARPAGESALAHHAAAIDEVFGTDDLHAVIDRIEALTPDTPWAAEAQVALRRASPTSLRVTWARMVNGANEPIARILQDDYRLAVRLVGGHDFLEGVRAILVDKDQMPRWHPARLVDVTDAQIAALLAPLEVELELPRAF